MAAHEQAHEQRHEPTGERRYDGGPGGGFSLLATLAADAAALSDELLTKELLAAEEDLAVIAARRAVLLAEVSNRHQGIPTEGAVGPFASPSASRWLAASTRRSQRSAGGVVNDALRLQLLPAVHEAFLNAQIRDHHVREILTAFNKDRDTVIAAEETIVEWAITYEWAEFVRRLRALLTLMDDADPADEALRRFERRGVRFIQLDSLVTMDVSTTPEVRAMFEAAINPLVAKLRDQDWAELVAAYGDDASWDKAVRNDTQRRHDALVQLVVSGAKQLDPDGAFTVNVVMDHETFERETERLVALDEEQPEPMDLDAALAAAESYRCSSLRGTSLASNLAMQMAITGHIRRVVITAPDAKVDVSKSRRFVRGLQRLGVRICHPRCVEPGCDAPSVDCEMDHVLPSSQGGQTETINAAPRCRWCHRWKTMKDVLGIS